MTINGRHIERHLLPCYLQVFNRYTGRLLGSLGNASESGLMLISDLPLLVDADFQLRLKVPAPGSGELMNVDLNATCLWCREDETPGIYDSGFRVLFASDGYAQLIRALQQYFSFRVLGESA